MDNSIEFHALPSVAAGRARGGRDTQQDDLACLYDPATHTYLLVLADGMGGDGAGELASQGVIDVAHRLWERGEWRRQPTSLFLESLCQAAHAELRRRQVRLASGATHSTVVALLVKDSRVAWAHVGDSRLYRFNGRRLMGRTEDHSLAQLKYRRGEISECELATHADQQQLLRGLGGPDEPVVDHGSGDLRRGHAFVLCSDGVWTQLQDDELGRFAQRRDQHEALHEAIHLAVERGGISGDNVSLIFARPQVGSGRRRLGGGFWPALWQAIFPIRRRSKSPVNTYDEV
ncbi:PP2C family protein-serine/threonine phosphatase [Dyella psychrodurans]|uniref:Serine/threonine-protein phosphatase n=1 Tax=Dyella psychrodurans TaxID=1927960 RepID=A0A370X6Y7_9GAMM|nr:PP2C family serine/threonine-protein phosphatase [Dyella psychrodurans]RDS84193.1 serine/threonine-protein phosphatase [Dyella psychrodurans]